MDFKDQTWLTDYDGNPKKPSAGELWWTAASLVVDNSVKLVPALLVPALLIVSFDLFVEAYAKPANSWDRSAFRIIETAILLLIALMEPPEIGLMEPLESGRLRGLGACPI